MTIVATLNGRLGNWLFQYAAARARALALEHATSVVLDASRYASWRHPFAGPVARALRFFRIEAAFTVRRATSPVFAEEGWGHDPRFHATGGDVRLAGYFQSPNYWGCHEAQIRADLQPRSLPHEAEVARLAERLDGGTSVALHVRRGDYLTFERDLHHVCTDRYYERALAYVRERVSGAEIHVFSDDPQWCRARFNADSTIVDLEASRPRPGLDLHLMSRCKHHIISNSTYSWWAAWLADRPGQIVCTPDRWFNDPVMNAAAMRDTVPAHWHRIPADAQPG